MGFLEITHVGCWGNTWKACGLWAIKWVIYNCTPTSQGGYYPYRELVAGISHHVGKTAKGLQVVETSGAW